MRTATAFRLLALGACAAAGEASPAGDASPRVTVVQVAGATKVVKAELAPDGTIDVLVDSADGPNLLRTKDAGATWEAPVPIVDAASRKTAGLEFHGWDLAVGKDGRVHVALGTNAWKLKLPKDEWSLRYANLAPGTRAFSPLRNLNKRPSEGFSLAAGEKGALAACFLADKLFAMTSKDDGANFTSPFEFDPSWNPCNCCTTSAAYGADGRLAVLYREETGDERDMWVVLTGPTLEPVRRRISTTGWKTDTCPMTYFSIARSGTGYVAVWPTKGQVYFARLDAEGAVLPPGEIRTPGTAGMRSGVLAIPGSDGSTLVAWKDKDVLGWQLYDSAGRPGEQSGSTPSRGTGCAGVPLPGGRFLLFP
jgi:hypothetical protein